MSGPHGKPAQTCLCSQTPSPAHVHKARLRLPQTQVCPRHPGAAVGVAGNASGLAFGRAGQTLSQYGAASRSARAPGGRDEALRQARARGPATPMCRGPAAGPCPCVPCPQSGLSHRSVPGRPGTSPEQALGQAALTQSPHSACRLPCVLCESQLPAGTG